MKASDLDRKDPGTPGAGHWLRVTGAAIGLVVICAVWTFWA
jgi:hypothetical protein